MRARRTGVISTAVLAALVVFALAAAAAPAGNRNPESSLVPSPGPAEINYGENVGYTATLVNSQSSTFTKVVYRHQVPTTLLAGASTAATLVYASCEPTRTSFPAYAPGGWYACPELSQLGSGDSAKVLTVWKAPGLPSQGDNITCGGTTTCALETMGEWSIKEGTGKTGSAGPDTFETNPVTTPLYAGSTDLTKARGYVLKTCSSGSSLETSVVTPVGPANKLHTSVCASTVPGASTDPLNPGLVVEIEEKAGPITEDVSLCIPRPGDSCSGVYTPWTFSPTATFSFTVDNRTLPAGEKIDKVLHDDGTTTGFLNVTGDCTIRIVNSQKITIVTCASATNGQWRFG